jgi:hypothetical protein
LGCNCNGGATSQTKYVYTSATGQQTVYTAEVQAQAAKIRERHETGREGTYKKVRA